LQSRLDTIGYGTIRFFRIGSRASSPAIEQSVVSHEVGRVAVENPDGPRRHLFRHREQGLHVKAARAVGAAVGKNPLAFVVPCHRVIGKRGDLTGYHGGLMRKRAMLGWGPGRVGA
jgi:hypothetical protein